MKVSMSGVLYSRKTEIKTEELGEYIKNLTKAHPDKTWILSEVVDKNNKAYLVLE